MKNCEQCVQIDLGRKVAETESQGSQQFSTLIQTEFMDQLLIYLACDQ